MIVEPLSRWGLKSSNCYRTRVRFKIIHWTHPCKYTVNHPYSWEASRNIAANLSQNNNQTNLLKICALSTPAEIHEETKLLSWIWSNVHKCSMVEKMKIPSQICIEVFYEKESKMAQVDKKGLCLPYAKDLRCNRPPNEPNRKAWMYNSIGAVFPKQVLFYITIFQWDIYQEKVNHNYRRCFPVSLQNLAVSNMETVHKIWYKDRPQDQT